MTSRTLLFAFFFVTLTPASAAGAQDRPLPVVPALDLDRYMGVWHEIARYPNNFERMCERDVTATYSRNPDGTVRVINACRKPDGEMASVDGLARIVAPPSKFKVRFAPAWLSWLPLVWADYWVIDLAADYSYAVVGEPDRDYLWILARDAYMSDDVYARICARLPALGFDAARLIRNPVR